jgi:putative restriction endonuclease
MDAQRELERRLHMWDLLKSTGGPTGVRPELVKRLGIHRGQQGIFRDQQVTSATGHASGVTVGILQTGRVYSDELSEQGLTYHYPRTNRGNRDLNEVSALRACKDLELPLFVVVTPHPRAKTRDVRLGWVVDDNPAAGLLLIMFTERQSAPPRLRDDDPEEKTEFMLRVSTRSKWARAKVRPNQWRFHFDVLKRYDPCCAVCRISHTELLEAAHLCPVEHAGCNDPRNGLVFCPTHHGAFERGMFRINPESLDIELDASVADFADLRLDRTSIRHLRCPPHPEALEWAWANRPLFSASS